MKRFSSLLIAASLVLNCSLVLSRTTVWVKNNDATNVFSIQQDSPLTLAQIQALIKNRTPDNAVATEIQRRGIDFTPTAPILDQLSQLGAGAKLLSALKASPVDKVDYATADLRCQRSKSGEGLARSKTATTKYSVDSTRHLLLDQGKEPESLVDSTGLDKLESRRLIVVHATSQIARLKRDRYAHVLITRDGAVKQLIPFNYALDHVTNNNWMSLSPVKKHSIAIELENAGKLWNKGNSWVADQFSELTVPDNDVVRLKGDIPGQGWHRFTNAQIHALFEVICALRVAYPTIENMIEHSKVDPVEDPGFIFPMEELRIRLFPR